MGHVDGARVFHVKHVVVEDIGDPLAGEGFT